MKIIAISSDGPGLDALVDARFGRAAGFVIVDLETQHTRYLDNGAAQNMARGAGIHAAETVSKAGAEVLLTGVVGPKALTALKSAGIKIGEGFDKMTVRQALEAFQTGKVALS